MHCLAFNLNDDEHTNIIKIRRYISDLNYKQTGTWSVLLKLFHSTDSQNSDQLCVQVENDSVWVAMLNSREKMIVSSPELLVIIQKLKNLWKFRQKTTIEVIQITQGYVYEKNGMELRIGHVRFGGTVKRMIIVAPSNVIDSLQEPLSIYQNVPVVEESDSIPILVFKSL
jgi:hypothetical protein